MQVFGAEEENIQKLEEVIKLQSKQSYKKKLTDFIKSGNSYSTSQKLVLNEYGYENIVKSNNILGLEYIRAIKKRKLKIKPYAIKREVSQYNEEKIEKNRIDNMASASFIRKEIEENNFEKIKRFVPENTYEILKEKVKERKEKGINDAILKNDIFKMVKYKFLTYSKKEIIKIYDTTEEIYVRIYNRLKESSSYNEFVKNVKSRNFSTKRIERIIMNIFLNVTLKSADFKVDYVRVLGFNSKGREYLKNMKDKFGNQKKIFVNWKDIEKDEKISSKKINIEKNGFLVKELLFEEKERLNPVVIE